MSPFCSLSSDTTELRFFADCGRSFGDNVSAMARSLSDWDLRNCSSAVSGVGGADFRFGAMFECCSTKVHEECVMWRGVCCSSNAPARGSYQQGTSVRSAL